MKTIIKIWAVPTNCCSNNAVVQGSSSAFPTALRRHGLPIVILKCLHANHTSKLCQTSDIHELK